MALTLLKFDGRDGDEGNRLRHHPFAPWLRPPAPARRRNCMGTAARTARRCCKRAAAPLTGALGPPAPYRYAEPKDQATLARAASCLQVEPEQLLQPLVSRRTYLMTGEMYVRNLDEHQAADAADALAKAVYGRMFDAVVARINALLGDAPEVMGDQRISAYPTPGTSASPGKPAAQAAAATFIGILDIFGFESFATNSFEQICINYANEVLQQQFNMDVFKQQQREYEAEQLVANGLPLV